MSNLLGKKVLFLAPSFFGYYKNIQDELKRQGCDVDIILENFSDTSYLYRFFYVKNEKLRAKYTQKYYNNRIQKINKNYDYVFVIRGEAITTGFLTRLRINNPDALFIIYQWDSIKNNKNALNIMDQFDIKFTFDVDDAKKYGWKYRPLFYIDGCEDTEDKTIDFAFIGTLYYKRAFLLKKIIEFCKNNNKILYNYLYSPKYVYCLHKYIMRDKRYTTIDASLVKFKSLKNYEVAEKYKKTKILVDYTADDQTGLTMRTIESLGFRCKLITNNKKIMETDIYQFGNIYIYDLDDFDIPKEFIETEYNDLPKNLNDYYSLTGWVKSIFSDH